MRTLGPNANGYHDVSDQMIDDLRRRAETHFRRQEAEKAELTSIPAFEEHRKRVRDHFMIAIGGLPEERTPLNVQCTGSLDRGTFTIEKLIYESLPQFYVTAALYVPKDIVAPQPAVVFVHGHSDLGKSYPTYQAVCVDLAANGFVVLAVDPPGQGERFQYFDSEKGERIIGGCTTEHTYAGLQFTLGGASVGRHFIWDVMRGVDYLETRPEVDPARIGLTGNSGGGTQSCLLMMSESRFAAAVPCTFIMTLESYMKTGQAQDSEQIVPGCFVNGPDHDDYITSMAPKPVLVGAAAYDYFPIEGAIEAVDRAKRIYALYGAEDRVDIAVAPTRHAYSPHLRQACVNWYKQQFRGESPDFTTGEPETLPDDALWATPNGQVLDLYPNGKTVFDLNRERLEVSRVSQFVTNHDTGQNLCDTNQMRETITEVLGIPEGRDNKIFPRILAENVVDGYSTEEIFFFSEPNIVVTGVFVKPLAGTVVNQTDLIIFENGTNDIPDKREWLEDRLALGRQLFVFDPRGIGGVQVRGFNRGGQPHDGEFKLGSDAMMLGISTMGLRVFDVLRGYNYLRTRTDVDRIGLYGIGKGAFYAYFAGALEDGFASLDFEDLLYSYRNLTDTRYYDQECYNLQVMAWGILRQFDLPDLAVCFGNRPVRWISPRNAEGEVLTDEVFEQEFLGIARERGYLGEEARA
jgi:dienelactone hydrolase